MFVHNIDQSVDVLGLDLGQPLKSSHSISDLQALSAKESNGEIYGILCKSNGQCKGPSDSNLSSNNSPMQRQRYGYSKRYNDLDFGYGKLDLSSSGISSSSSGIARHLNKSEMDCAHCNGSNIDIDCHINDMDLMRAKHRNRNALLKRMADARAGKRTLATNLVEHNRVVKVFDMSKFKAILERESRRTNPNRILLQNLCISIVSFVLNDKKILNLPSWIMIINIVAIDLLRTQIGLTDPYGLQLPPALSCAPADRCDLMAYSAVGEHATGLPMRKVPSKRIAPLTASKKAFAEAAASGVFDDDDYYDTSMYAQAKISYESHKKMQPKGRDCKDKHLEDKRFTEEAESKLLNSKSSNKVIDGHHRTKATQSSSSSGFNSNSFSQNTDSSAASSSSNITISSSGCDADGTSSNGSKSNSKNNSSDSGEFIRIVDSKLDNNSRNNIEDRFKSAISKDASDKRKELQQKRIANNVCLAATKALLFKKQQSKIDAGDNGLLSKSLDTNLERPSTPRGDRLPKTFNDPSSNLGMRNESYAEKADGESLRPIVSRPIPIPAPPTCSGDSPSGKANLILVSPTGLSPPLQRRTNSSCKSLPEQLEELGSKQCENDENEVKATVRLPEFSSIKHIDEYGQCSVLIGNSLKEHKINISDISSRHYQYMNQYSGPLLDSKQSKNRAQQQPLPAGIPPHAQLAPPATQRHILRYLMSATQHKLVDILKHRKNGNIQKQSFMALARNDDIISTPVMRYQRPLPILPGQKRPAPLPLSATRPLAMLHDHRHHRNPLPPILPPSSHKQPQSQQPQQQNPQEDNLYYCGLQARIPSRRIWSSSRPTEPSFSRNLYYY